MALSDLLAESRRAASPGTDGVVDEDRVARDADRLREVVSMWRCYPDRFVDYLCSLNPHNTFHLYFYQRFA